MDITDYKLFTPLALADDLVLKNRVVLCPMTRARTDRSTLAPNASNAKYYEQRSGAGLIITAATAVSAQGAGWYGAPGIYTNEQREGWAKVTDAVHAKGGKIFVQLWHMGRQAHSSYNGGKQTVSASGVALNSGFQIRDASGARVELETPRALESGEVRLVVEQYRSAAEMAKQAGFDGVEITAAGGYLIDEFLQSVSNNRADAYGGSIQNRARFLLEVVEAVKTVWPSNHIGVRMSPNGRSGGSGSGDNYEQFTYTMGELGKHNVAYVATLDGEDFGTHGKDKLVKPIDIKRYFKGVVFACVGYTRDIAEGALRSGAVDAVGFGRPFLSNPDLVERFQNDWPLNPTAPYDVWYDANKGAEGYTSFEPYRLTA